MPRRFQSFLGEMGFALSLELSPGNDQFKACEIQCGSVFQGQRSCVVGGFCQERRDDPRRRLEFSLKTTGERAGGGIPGKMGFPLSAPARQRLKGRKGPKIFDLEESVYGSRRLWDSISPAPSKDRFSAVIFTRLKKKRLAESLHPPVPMKRFFRHGL